ncbi:MAG: peptidoglycan editing factor PgeF [Bacteroidales bacterium]
MEYKKFNNMEFGVFTKLEKHNKSITHFFTTRKGGVSSGSYESLNLGMMQDDENANVIKNRSRVANAVGLSPDDFVYPIQVHGTNVVRILENDRGKGSQSLSDAFANTDGFITNVPRLCIMTLAADCVPIIFFDPIKMAVGVAHAGWKGTALKIPSVLVESMKREFGSNPKDLIVGIGPSGGPSCYEVGNDVIEEVAKKFNVKKVIKNINGKTIFDMWEANTISLVESGVKPENIEVSDICTISQNETFFSARHSDGGRFAAGIFIQ